MSYEIQIVEEMADPIIISGISIEAEVSQIDVELTIPNTIVNTNVVSGLTAIGFTTVSLQNDYTLPDIVGAEVVAVKKGNLFIDPSQFDVVGDVFSFLSDLHPIDGGEDCILFVKY